MWISGVLVKQSLGITPDIENCNKIEVQKYIESWKSPRFYKQAETYLNKCSYLTIPILIEQIDVKYDEGTRINAIFLVSEFDEKLGFASPTLVSLSKDPNKNIRTAAIGSLAAIGRSAEPVLREFMKNGDVDDRTIAASILLNLGVVDKNASSLYVAILSNNKYETNVRAEAASVLSDIGSNPAISALVKALKDSNQIVSFKAIDSLGRIGVRAKDAIPSLVAMLESNPNSRCTIVHALQSISPRDINIRVYKTCTENERISENEQNNTSSKIDQHIITDNRRVSKNVQNNASLRIDQHIRRNLDLSFRLTPETKPNNTASRMDMVDNTVSNTQRVSSVARNSFDQPKACRIPVIMQVISFWCSKK
jgi:HEAT repeat protein